MSFPIAFVLGVQSLRAGTWLRSDQVVVQLTPCVGFSIDGVRYAGRSLRSASRTCGQVTTFVVRLKLKFGTHNVGGM